MPEAALPELWRFRQQGTRERIIVRGPESDIAPGVEYHEFRNVGFREKWDQDSIADFIPVVYARKVNDSDATLPMQEGEMLTCVRRIPVKGSIVEGLHG